MSKKSKLEEKLDFIEQEALRRIPCCAYGIIQKIKEYSRDIRKKIKNSEYKDKN